ncbi:Zinc finger bed domain-containing protein 5 [Plakobranchus ocellatus]|uniref:Zinc finger bed domain-containing protein 5 n=1 Tax=Plakobranchus ocellatus TaxID=259542 RepID=A0AAV4CR39_9GAST|nr:Zinc finger bed domain-containing protein 5 [Plakobranchus ocellatus]
MFPDSKITQGFQCGRTKTTAVPGELSADQQKTLVVRMQKGPFSISTDGSNHTAGDKQFPLMVRTVGENLTVQSELLAVPTCKGSATGEAIFTLIADVKERNNIPWTNCVALGCDNASVMTGVKKGVIAFMKGQQPNMYLAGCTLHLAHIAAEKGANTLPFLPSELLTDMYYYLQHF